MYSGVIVMYRTMADAELVGAVMRLIEVLKPRVAPSVYVTSSEFSLVDFYLSRLQDEHDGEYFRQSTYPMCVVDIGESLEQCLQMCLLEGYVRLWLLDIDAVIRVQTELEQRVGKAILGRYAWGSARVSIGRQEIVNCEDDGWPRLIARPNFAFILSGGDDVPEDDRKEVIYSAIVKSRAFGDLRSIVEGVVGPVEVSRY